MPEMVPSATGVLQMHSIGYRNPDQLPEGAVLVVGSGSSGTQIAEELLEVGTAASTFRWGRMSVRRGPIVGATTAGGWVFLASGTRQPGRPERST